MIDPLILKTIAIGLALLFIGSARHKLSAPDQFAAVLADYRLMPEIVTRPLAYLIPLFELALGFAWLFAVAPRSASIISIALLSIYASAIAINLLRGRSYIDCGCGFGVASARQQALSLSLVLRNIGLIGLAGLILLPAADRVIGVTDYVVIFVALLIAILLYAASGQLINNWVAIQSWRGK